MNVLHVIPKMNPAMGGVCQAVRSIIEGLNHHSIQSEVVSLDEPSALFLRADEFVTHALGSRPGRWIYSAALKPWLLVNLSRFSIVIIHGMWNYHAFAVRSAVKHLQNEKQTNAVPKIYIMPHGMLDPYFQKTKTRRLKAIRNWIYWQLVERHIVNNVEGLLFTCEEEKRLAAEPFKQYYPKRQVVTGLGIGEPPAFSHVMMNEFFAKCPSCKDSSYLLFLGRIDEKKGVEFLLHAYQRLSNSSHQNKLDLPKLVVAGPGLELEYGRKLQTLSRAMGLEHEILFPGSLRGDAKWGAFYGADAFVLPSHQENFGIAVVEALSCSTPVIITDRVNIWKEIANSGGGIICGDTTENLFEALNGWLELTPNNKSAMANNARRIYEKEFAIASASRRLYSVIEPHLQY